ncbi:MAG: hypothetical protein ACHP7K_12525, partial [Actinomycetales bacterium]
MHGEEAAVGEVEDAGREAVLQLIRQGVLAVVVAADRSADPPEGRGADVGGDPQQRAAPSAGVPNPSSSTPFLASSIVVPSMAVTSRPFHSRPMPRSASAAAASSSK